MGYFQVRYDSRVVNYDRRGFIRLATDGYIILHYIWPFTTKKSTSGNINSIVDLKKLPITK